MAHQKKTRTYREICESFFYSVKNSSSDSGHIMALLSSDGHWAVQSTLRHAVAASLQGSGAFPFFMRCRYSPACGGRLAQIPAPPGASSACGDLHQQKAYRPPGVCLQCPHAWHSRAPRRLTVFWCMPVFHRKAPRAVPYPSAQLRTVFRRCDCGPEYRPQPAD